MVFVLWSSPNHTPFNYRSLIRNSMHINTRTPYDDPIMGSTPQTCMTVGSDSQLLIAKIVI